VLVRRQGEQKSVSRARAHVVGGGTFHTSSVVVFTSWDTDAETEKRVTPDSLPEALGETDASWQISRTTRALHKLMLRWASEEEEDAGVGKRRRRRCWGGQAKAVAQASARTCAASECFSAVGVESDGSGVTRLM
jgi:hypothetical protein